MFDVFDEPPAPENQLVKLELLKLEHTPALTEVALDESIWKHSIKDLKHYNEKGVEHYVRNMLQEFEYRNAATYVVFCQADGKAAGCIKMERITPRHQRLDIGGAWLGVDYRGKGLFRAAAYELLAYAFGEGDALRVGFYVDDRNAAAVKSVEGLGAVSEGVLRKHAITSKGEELDVRVFSITDEDWPGVKARLQKQVAA